MFIDIHTANLRCHLGIFAQMAYKTLATQSSERAAVAPVAKPERGLKRSHSPVKPRAPSGPQERGVKRLVRFLRTAAAGRSRKALPELARALSRKHYSGGIDLRNFGAFPVIADSFEQALEPVEIPGLGKER